MVSVLYDIVAQSRLVVANLLKLHQAPFIYLEHEHYNEDWYLLSADT